MDSVRAALLRPPTVRQPFTSLITRPIIVNPPTQALAARREKAMATAVSNHKSHLMRLLALSKESDYDGIGGPASPKSRSKGSEIVNSSPKQSLFEDTDDAELSDPSPIAAAKRRSQLAPFLKTLGQKRQRRTVNFSLQINHEVNTDVSNNQITSTSILSSPSRQASMLIGAACLDDTIINSPKGLNSTSPSFPDICDVDLSPVNNRMPFRSYSPSPTLAAFCDHDALLYYDENQDKKAFNAGEALFFLVFDAASASKAIPPLSEPVLRSLHEQQRGTLSPPQNISHNNKTLVPMSTLPEPDGSFASMVLNRLSGSSTDSNQSGKSASSRRVSFAMEDLETITIVPVLDIGTNVVPAEAARSVPSLIIVGKETNFTTFSLPASLCVRQTISSEYLVPTSLPAIQPPLSPAVIIKPAKESNFKSGFDDTPPKDSSWVSKSITPTHTVLEKQPMLTNGTDQRTFEPKIDDHTPPECPVMMESLEYLTTFHNEMLNTNQDLAVPSPSKTGVVRNKPTAKASRKAKSKRA